MTYQFYEDYGFVVGFTRKLAEDKVEAVKSFKCSGSSGKQNLDKIPQVAL